MSLWGIVSNKLLKKYSHLHFGMWNQPKKIAVGRMRMDHLVELSEEQKLYEDGWDLDTIQGDILSLDQEANLILGLDARELN